MNGTHDMIKETAFNLPSSYAYSGHEPLCFNSRASAPQSVPGGVIHLYHRIESKKKKMWRDQADMSESQLECFLHSGPVLAGQ